MLKVAFGEAFQEMEEEGSLPVLLSGHKAMGNLIEGKRIRSGF